jgi:hypothetical protein
MLRRVRYGNCKKQPHAKINKEEDKHEFSLSKYNTSFNSNFLLSFPRWKNACLGPVF